MKPEEFNHIVLPMRSKLKDYSLRLAGNDDDAEDLVQEVMLRLWSVSSRLKTEQNISAFAFTIARNMYYDKWRHNKVCRQADTDNQPDIAIEDLKAERNDEMKLIGRIIESLPPLQRQIFKMKEIEGYESSEIMQITGCTADNLRKNLSRARLRIRESYLKIMRGNDYEQK